MQAGKLRHRVTIQEQSTARDTFGQRVDTWTTVATVWASVEPLQGREFLDGRSLEAEISLRVRMRYRSGVEPTMRLSWGGRIFEIVAITSTEERGRELVLMCREAVA